MRYLVTLCVFISLIVPYTVQAEVLRLRLENGKEVILKDDFTWQYVTKAEGQPQAQPSPVVATSLPAPQVMQHVQTNQVVTQHSGVVLTLQLEKWREGAKTIPVTIENGAFKPIIAIDVTLNLYNSQGNLIHSHEYAVWRSIKRMPDTYLRVGQSKTGTAIKLNVDPSQVARVEMVVNDINFR